MFCSTSILGLMYLARITSYNVCYTKLLRKFAELDKCGKALDAELAMQEKYQRMLATWQACPRHYKLSIQEIRKILNA